MQIDPATRMILDFIAARESNGNYNAVIGNSRSTDDLSAKTLTGIFSLQDRLRMSGRPSTAVGRYQFLKGTLSRLAEQKRLDPTATMFTPTLQDELAVELLIGRGYSQWWRGQLDDSEFAHRLSCEWASLPDPCNDGHSHYDGDAAGNHAGRTLEEVYAMLRQARGLIPAGGG